ncbi:hypothetical protein [Miniphocaeibacter halophilus]|uniref:Uncharacterized protein n=1 Tax=Miniphocaeibacter halophilus TaxID=2931922 RepID=A0AC61MRG1_9FIRM|nr:hypothetical protein [Miniphocaeibacter halophilus]QQK08154.1 hypothetical protein JFY71_01060 [Miniphocaeibacter halophilus]
MASENKVITFVKNLGYEPVEKGSIIVRYLPENLSAKIAKMFTAEIYVLQICKNEIILLPFSTITGFLKEETSLVIKNTEINSVEIKEEFLNYNIYIKYGDEIIALTAQQAETSDLRSNSFYGAGHKKNLKNVLSILSDFNKNT